MAWLIHRVHKPVLEDIPSSWNVHHAICCGTTTIHHDKDEFQRCSFLAGFVLYYLKFIHVKLLFLTLNHLNLIILNFAQFCACCSTSRSHLSWTKDTQNYGDDLALATHQIIKYIEFSSLRTSEMFQTEGNIDLVKLLSLFGENQSQILNITFVYQRQLNIFILLQNLFDLLMQPLQMECDKLETCNKRGGRKKLFHCAQRDFVKLILSKRLQEIKPQRRMVPGIRISLSYYIANVSVSELYCLNLILVLESRNYEVQRISFKLPPMHSCYYVCDYNLLVQLYLNPTQTLLTKSSCYWEEMRQRLLLFCSSSASTYTLCSIQIESPELPHRLGAEVASSSKSPDRLDAEVESLSKQMDAMRYVLKILQMIFQQVTFSLQCRSDLSDPQLFIYPYPVPVQSELVDWLSGSCQVMFAEQVVANSLHHISQSQSVMTHLAQVGKLQTGSLFMEFLEGFLSDPVFVRDLTPAMEFYASKHWSVAFDQFLYFADDEPMYCTMFACTAANILHKYLQEPQFWKERHLELPINFSSFTTLDRSLLLFMKNIHGILKGLGIVPVGQYDMLNSEGVWGLDLTVTAPLTGCFEYARDYHFQLEEGDRCAKFRGVTVLVNPFAHSVHFELASSYQPANVELVANSMLVISGDCPYKQSSNYSGALLMYYKAFIPALLFRNNTHQFDKVSNNLKTIFVVKDIPTFYGGDNKPPQLRRYVCAAFKCVNKGTASYPWCDNCLSRQFAVCSKVSPSDQMPGLFSTRAFKEQEVVFTETLVNDHFELIDESEMKRRYPFESQRAFLIRLDINNKSLFWDQSKCKGILSCAAISDITEECNCRLVFQVTDSNLSVSCVVTESIETDVELVVFRIVS